MTNNNACTDIDTSLPLETEGYVCPEQKVTLPPLNATSVQVALEYVGLCHTDVHMRDNDWGSSDYPLLLGHEGVGTVTHVGPSVRTLSRGDTVGIGWIRDCCRTCPRCRVGQDNLCSAGYQGTYLGKSAGIWGRAHGTNEHGGCFARVQRIEERFAVRLSPKIAPHIAATMLCGGATVYEPLVRFGFVGARVGVIGIGGLGRWALKLAKIRACTVVAISTSERKRQLAIDAGADEFWIVENDCLHPGAAMGKLDLIVDTRPVNGNLAAALAVLAHGGTYCRVGIPHKDNQDFNGKWIPTLFQEQAITATAVTGSSNVAHMVQLCDDNLDLVMKGEDSFSAEIVPMHEVNDAMNRLLNRQNKGYRYVLKW